MKNGKETYDPRRSEGLWLLVEGFYRARRIFDAVHANYEARVLAYSRERGVDRLDLRLSVEEVGGLLNFRELEDLRNKHLYPLKDVCHELFRDEDRTDKLDRYISDIFHEVSILKEEQYKVKDMAAGYGEDAEAEEVKTILDEVHDTFPQKVHHIHTLFRKAQVRLEEILPRYREDRVLIRSLYLQGPEVLRDVYPDGIDGFYRMLYPGGGPLEGRYLAGKSFMEAGFFQYAREALDKALGSVGSGAKAGTAGEGTAMVDEIRLIIEKLRRVQPATVS